MTNDHKYNVHTTHAGVIQWRVKTGITLVTVCKDEPTAIAMCENLNKDKWHLLRGQTRKERCI